MDADPNLPLLTPLRAGERFIVDAVDFVYHPNVPDLIADTRGAPPVEWRWVAVAKVGLYLANTDQQMMTFTGSVFVGVLGVGRHFLLNSQEGTTGFYYGCDVRQVIAEAQGTTGLVTKRPKSIWIDVPGAFQVATGLVTELGARGAATKKREAALLAGLSV